MDVSEESPTRLVLNTYTGWITYVAGVVAFGFGLLLIIDRGGNSFGNNVIVYKLLIGPIGVVAGLAMLLGPFKCILTIDKSVGYLTIKKSYMFGLVPMTKNISFAEINKFIVQHQTRYNLRAPALKFIFKSPGHKTTFYSQNLHFGGKSGFFVQLNQIDAHNSDEEQLIPLIASYINIPAITQERGIDSPNSSKMLLFVSAYMVGGFIVAIGLIWFYYHIIHTR